MRIVGQGSGGDRIFDDLRRLGGMSSATGTLPETIPAQLARAAQYPELMTMIRGVDGAASAPVSNTWGRPAETSTQNMLARGGAEATSNLAAMLTLADAASGAAAGASSLGPAGLSGRQNNQNQYAGVADGTSNLIAFLRGANGSTDESGTASPRRRSGRDP